MTAFRQPSLLLEEVAGATFTKKGEGSRKSGLFWPKWEQVKLLIFVSKNQQNKSNPTDYIRLRRVMLIADISLSLVQGLACQFASPPIPPMSAAQPLTINN
jgi:hypothetical protein